MAVLLIYVFFFSSRRRHTRLQGDWSSDVCSSDLLSGRESVATSRPSLMNWLTNTIATCDAFASLAAAAGSLPSLYSTVACGALARMYFKGEDGNQTGCIHGEPPFRWVTA